MKIYSIATKGGSSGNFLAHLIMEHNEFLKYDDHTIVDDGIKILHGMVNSYNPIPKDIVVAKYRAEPDLSLAQRIKSINELDTMAQYSASIEEYLDKFYPGSNYTADSNIITFTGPDSDFDMVRLFLDTYRDKGMHLVIVGVTDKDHINKVMTRRSVMNHNVTPDDSLAKYEKMLKEFIAEVKATDGLEWSFVNIGRMVYDGDEDEYTEMCTSLGITPDLALFNEKLAWYNANVLNV